MMVEHAVPSTKAVPLGSDGATVHDAGETQWWFDARAVTEDDVLQAVEKSSCTHIVLDLGQLNTTKTKKQRVVWIDRLEELEGIDNSVWVFSATESIRSAAVARQMKSGLLINVVDLEKDFPYCIAICERGDDFVVIDGVVA